MIRLRFVTGNDALSALIRAQAGICVPFTPSHVECLSQDGKFYIGERFGTGMQARPLDYDAGSVLHEKIVALSASDAEEAAFYKFVTDKIGEPYDWRSIISFAAPSINLHDFGHLICSAISPNRSPFLSTISRHGICS